MIFRRCNINGVDYNHPPSAEEQNNTANSINAEPPILIPNEDLFPKRFEQIDQKYTPAALLIQEFFVILSICNTVVVCKTPHKDILRESGQLNNSISAELTVKRDDRYSRLTESRSITPSPPNSMNSLGIIQKKSSKKIPKSPNASNKSLSIISAKRFSSQLFSKSQESTKMDLIDDHEPNNVTRPIYEAESPDELTLVNAAFSYDYQLVHRSPNLCVILTPDAAVVEYEVLKILPFDSNRKCMSVVVRKQGTNDIILYTKGADSAIMSVLAETESEEESKYWI